MAARKSKAAIATFSPRLMKRARGERTRRELAHKLNVTEGTVYNWETGKTTPDVNDGQRIAAALDVDPNDLFE